MRSKKLRKWKNAQIKKWENKKESKKWENKEIIKKFAIEKTKWKTWK